MSSSQTQRTPKRPKPRLESLSDLIYGLSLSIGAISLVITNNQASSIGLVNYNILQFVFVFLILITNWIIYTGDMSVLPIETRLVTFLNIVMLVLVAITPYLFDQVVSTTNPPDVQDYASILFTIDYAITLFILAAFAHIIAQEEEHLVDGEIMVRFRRTRTILAYLGLIVLIAIAVPWEWTFLQVRVRLWIWYLPIVMFWFNRMRRITPYGPSKSPTQNS